MPLNVPFEFEYFREPFVPVRVTSPVTGRTARIWALIDTGAQGTILDMSVALELGLDFSNATERVFSGIAGQLTARSADVELRLLDESSLAMQANIAFAAGVDQDVGNLIGLDILSSFDFALSHANRICYLGRAQA